MPAERTCGQCGAPLPANAPGSRCPKCLLALAVADTGVGGEESPAVPGKTIELSESDIIAEQTGTMIGRYKLLQQIGEGGFGIVFMAEQTEPVQRKVALKVIKAGMDSREVIARFEAERQALALMDHPNIAQVLDGGTTAGGRPYFVMELVRGVPITAYCDHASLSTRERLELFIKVCRAVQHAHQKGVIHRDLKPSNVLVTLHDGEPVPKVIDFGVAKALGQKLTDKTLFTRFEQMIGTPAYMSPEQAALSGLDIDTRSDIYSLGVLLYELLTGVTPLDTKTLREAALDEIRRMIQETEPPRPSTRVATLGERLADVAKCRHAEPAALTRLIRGDLDWITMKTLEKDRRRRYETVNGLAMDLERHLNHEPVAARPPSAAYRFQRTVQRHRVAFAAGTTVLIALVLGVAVSTWQAVRATRAEREQSRLRQQAQTAQANEEQQRQRAEGNFQKARDAVDRLSTRVAAELNDVPHMEQVRRRLLLVALAFHQGFLEQKGDDPAVRYDAALAQLRVGDIHGMLGQYDKSLAPFGQALALLEDLAKRQPTEARYREKMAAAYTGLAWANKELGRTTSNTDYERKLVALSEELQREFPTVPAYLRRAAGAHSDLGNALKTAGRSKEAAAEHQQALKLFEWERTNFPSEPENREQLAFIQHWLGASLEDIGQFEEAERALRTSHDLRTQLVAEQPQNARLKYDLAHVKAYLAKSLNLHGELSKAEELLRQAVEIEDKLLEDFPEVADYRHRAGWGYKDLGDFLTATRRPQEAERAVRHSLAIREMLVADLPAARPRRQELANSCYDLGVLLEAVGKSDEAAEAFRKSLGILEQLVAQDSETPSCQRQMGWMLTTCPAVKFRDPQRALRLAQQALQREPESAANWSLLGIAQYRAGDPAATIRSLHKTMELADGRGAKEWLFLAMAYWKQGDRSEAQKWYDKAVAWIEKNRPWDEVDSRFRAEAEEVLGKPKGQ